MQEMSVKKLLSIFT